MRTSLCTLLVMVLACRTVRADDTGDTQVSKKPIAAAQKKSPLPDEAAQAKAFKLAKEVYGEAGKAATTPGQKREFAQKLLAAADESENDLPGRYILLKLARDFATQATDGELAFEAIDKMADRFQIDDADMKMNVLTAFSKRAKQAAEHKSIGEQAVGLIDGAIARDNIDFAAKLCDLALPEARASRDADLIRDIKAKGEQCRTLVKAFREMKEATAVLDKKPDDPAANLAAGKYYCFQKGDWEKGLPMLALGQDAALKAVATQEIGGVSKVDDEVKVGDAWWDLADKEQGKTQTTLRGRASYWYQKALPELSGLAKAKVEKRIKEYESASAGSGKTEGPVTPKGRYLSGLVAQYYNDTHVARTVRHRVGPIVPETHFTNAVKARVDANLDFDWNNNPPDPAVNAEYFSAGWIGYIKVPKAGRYVIRAKSMHDSEVAIDKAFVITNQLSNIHRCDQEAEVTLTAGYHLLAVRFVHGMGWANIHLSWQPPGAASWSAIPPENLFHDQKQEHTFGVGRH